MRAPYTKIRIEGLSCLGGGAANLERELARLPGISEVYVNPATEVAYLWYDADALSVPAILETIERAGYRGVLLEPGETTGRVDTRAAP